jgi:ribosomal-protein-serine acetyltransferase
MFYREIDTNLKLALALPIFVEKLYSLVDQNRDHLRPWMPWLDKTTEPKHIEDFIKSSLTHLTEGKGLNCLIMFEDNLVGLLSYNVIEAPTLTGHIGYWLDKGHNGQGIMTKSVAKMIEIGFKELGLRKVEIRVAAENTKSRAIPERLGFKMEGTLRNAENISGNYVDHVIYGLMKDEWQA